MKDFVSQNAVHIESRPAYSRNHPRQVMLANTIVNNLIIGCNLPVSLVDNPKFRQCFKDFDQNSYIYCVCHQYAHLLLIHSGLGLTVLGLGLGLDLGLIHFWPR